LETFILDVTKACLIEAGRETTPDDNREITKQLGQNLSGLINDEISALISFETANIALFCD